MTDAVSTMSALDRLRGRLRKLKHALDTSLFPDSDDEETNEQECSSIVVPPSDLQQADKKDKGECEASDTTTSVGAVCPTCHRPLDSVALSNQYDPCVTTYAAWRARSLPYAPTNMLCDALYEVLV